jgi:MtN3 and saliva related transmembrane protein
MDTAQMANVFGFAAAAIGIVMFFPQAFKVWQTKDTKSISLVSFIMLFISSILWLTYGLLLSAAPVILVNFVLATLSLFIVGMKLRYK